MRHSTVEHLDGKRGEDQEKDGWTAQLRSAKGRTKPSVKLHGKHKTDIETHDHGLLPGNSVMTKKVGKPLLHRILHV